MISKVFRSGPQDTYNLKPSIRINLLKRMSTSKEVYNKSRGRSQRQASKESNIYCSELKRNITFIFYKKWGEGIIGILAF